MNKNKLVPFLILAVLLSGCGLSSERRYSEEISPIAENLMQWQGEYSSVAEEWLEDSTFYGGYNRAIQLFSKDESMDPFLDTLNSLETDGQSILNVIGLITPPEEIRIAHEQVVACIKTRLQFMEVISSSITAWTAISFPPTAPDLSSCLTFDAALTKIIGYANLQK